MKKHTILAALAVVSALALFILIFMYYDGKEQDEKVNTVFSELEAYLSDFSLSDESLVFVDEKPEKAAVPETKTGLLLYNAYYDGLEFYSPESITRRSSSATGTIRADVPSFSGLEEILTSGLQAALEEKLAAASVSTEVYNRDLTFRSDTAKECFENIFDDCLSEALEASTAVCTVTLEKNENGEWLCSDYSVLKYIIEGNGTDFDAYCDTLFENAFSSLSYVRKEYSLPVDTHAAPVPDPEGFHTTTDYNDILDMLNDPYAVQLLDGREPFFNAELPFVPDANFYWYLDESILVIVWKEVTAGCVGTYSEIVLASGSQLCRKIVDDTPYVNKYITATQLASQTNCVLAIGGDLYAHSGRRIGIQVYDGEVISDNDSTSDTCMFTADGDMIFTYKNQFETLEEAQAFVDENNVRFSVSFGPVIIENGEDVTPASYVWGEINDTYARAAIGMKDSLCHYLTVNINEAGPSYWNLATLQDETDAMMAHGCTKAYALDGGQTCCTVFNGTLINRVQFNKERDTSDIIFFATAIDSN